MQPGTKISNFTYYNILQENPAQLQRLLASNEAARLDTLVLRWMRRIAQEYTTIQVYIYIYMYITVYVYVYMYICMYVCIYILYMDIYKYMYVCMGQRPPCTRRPSSALLHNALRSGTEKA
jgi:hypothetical protein